MSIRVKWLDAKEIENLRREIEYVGSEELKDELDDFITNNPKREGKYLCNLLNASNLLELEEIRKNYIILTLA